MNDIREEQKIDVGYYLSFLLKHRSTIITVFSVIVITTFIHSFTATPIYEATTRLIIDKENPNVVSIQEVMNLDSSDTDYYQTQYKIIESRAVARDTIRKLHLDENDEFNKKRRENFITRAIVFWAKFVVSLVRSDNAEDDDAYDEYAADSDMVTKFIKKIEVAPVRNSRLVDISFRSKSPVIAAKIANTIAQSYIDQNLETRLNAVQDAVKWLNKRIEEERKKVGNAELALLQYKKEYGIITDFTNEEENITAQKLAQLNTQVVEAESKRVEAETRYKQALAMSGTPDMLDSINEVLRNPLIEKIKSMEVELYKQMSELSKKYGKNHPQMVAIESEFKALQDRKVQEVDRVINSLKNEYRVAEARENSVKEALARQKGESLALNQKAIEFTVLKREAESAKEMYDLLIKRFKEASLTEDMKTGNIRIIDKAEVPKRPVSPKKGLNILLAVVVGLAAGIGITAVLEYLDNTIKLPEDIKRHLNIPYLGPVPSMGFEMSESEGRNETETIPELITLNFPKSTASEAYRGIRTNILFSSAGAEPQVILVTSAGPQEGKTLTAANIAITMAQAGSKVVVIDCDLRRPKMHKMFGVDRERGMTNLLVGNMELKDAVQETKIPNLYLIPSGPIPPNPSEILGSSRMEDLVKTLRENFVRVIIDSPPITAVTDAVIIGKSTDGTALVIRANETGRDIIANGIEHLRSVGARILGAILNDVDMSRDGYYYKQYYYYYYGEDGEKKEKIQKKKKTNSFLSEDV